jgi:hypothetical protein
MSLEVGMKALLRRRGTMAILFLLWALWLAFPYFGFGAESYVRIFDNGDSTLPAKVSMRTATPSHLLSAWNPQPVTGVDQVPVTSSADLDNWLFAILPGWLAYGLVMFAQRFIAGYFTYRLLKDRLRAGFLASLCGGLVYAMFAQLTINVSWAGITLYDGLALAGLPFLLWALDDRETLTHGRRLIMAGGLGLLLGITSLYFSSVFVVLAVAVWLLVRQRASARQAPLVVGLFVMGWAAAEVPAIWASVLNAPLSQRGGGAWLIMSLRVAVLRQYSIVRGILLDNQLMVAAALLGFAATRFRSRALMVAIGASAVILLLVLGSALWLMGVKRYFGPLAGFQIDRFYLLAPFALIVSGALGLDAISVRLRGRLPAGGGGRRSRLWAASLTLLVLLLLGPLASARVQQRILHEMGAGSTYAALYQRPELQRLAAVGAGAGAAPCRVATVYAPQSFAPAPSPWAHLFGPLPAYAWAYGLETADGYVVMYPERYRRFWERVSEPALQSDRLMSDRIRDYGNRHLFLFVPSPGVPLAERRGLPLPAVTDLADLCNLNLLSLANVRYVISPVRLSGDGLSLVSADAHGEPWPLFIYENSHVLPRYFVVGSSRTYPDLPRLLSAMSSASLQDLRSVAFVERPDSPVLAPEPSSGASGRVRLLTYASDDVSLSVTVGGRSLLVCTMNYSPYWQAFVDGREVNVIRTDGTFVGVVVPGGAHRVDLRYRPPYAWLFPS